MRNSSAERQREHFNELLNREVGKGEERAAVFQTANLFSQETLKKMWKTLGKLRTSKAAGHRLFLLNYWKMGGGDKMKAFTSYFYWLGGLKQ